MITVRIKGGLGNQLFQYASAYALSSRLNQKLVIDNSFFHSQTLRGYKLANLNIESKEITLNEQKLVKIYKNKYLNKVLRKMNFRTLPCMNNTSYLLETRSDIVPEFFTINKKNIYIDGYYQSTKYFSEYRQSLLEQFTPTYPMEAEYIEELEKILECNSVAVHLRRGDFLNAQNDSNPNHYLLGEQYYHNSLKYIEKNVENPVFFWFSDDIEWVKKKFGEKQNYRFVSLKTKHGDIDELMLMKNCHHIISANSTFSWWASWLNEHEDAIHTCPERRYGNLHMIPEDWVKIPVD